ncbi:MAG TPA: hypothetical protein VN894_16010 [Polyangiaceae bacterium]|nr:hypothetical protein [Polyangiaceae bacterium]
MPTSLRQRLHGLASAFASDVLDAIRGASVRDLLGASPAGARPAPARGEPVRRRVGRLPRRSAGDIAQVVDHIVGLLRQSPNGLRAEQIRAKLGLQAKELPRPLNDAIESGRLAKSGQKRATTYFVKGAASKPAAGRQARGAPAARRGRTNAKRAKAAKPAEKAEKNEKRVAAPGAVIAAEAQK